MSAFARIVDEIAAQVQAEHGGVPYFATLLKEAEGRRFRVLGVVEETGKAADATVYESRLG